ncbi:MAG: hypothetical protein AB7G93_01210 [Bdellovibrionales bacterium]
MTVNLQPPGRIGTNDKWKWVLDGIELKGREMLEIRIDGHWILGMLIESKEGRLYWSSWIDSVSIPVTYFMQARWTHKD